MNVVDAVGRGDLREMGEQDRREPAALHLVGDLEGDLGPARATRSRTSRGATIRSGAPVVTISP